jgi:hypothetical protein
MAGCNFGGGLYRYGREFHRAIAEQWLTARGANSREDIEKTLATTSSTTLAAEVLEASHFGDCDDFREAELTAAFDAIKRDPSQLFSIRTGE